MFWLLGRAYRHAHHNLLVAAAADMEPFIRTYDPCVKAWTLQMHIPSTEDAETNGGGMWTTAWLQPGMLREVILRLSPAPLHYPWRTQTPCRPARK